MDKDEINTARVDRLMQKYKIQSKDAIILDCLNELTRKYDYFITEILKIDSNAEQLEYTSTIPIQEYFKELEILTNTLINIATALRDSHPQVSQVFAPKIDQFQKDIIALSTTGKKEVVLKLGLGLRAFKLELGDLVKSGRPEKMLDTYMIATEERTQRVWTAGLKKLAKSDRATILLSWMVRYGRGIPMSIAQIAAQMPQSESFVEKHMREIRELAPELLALGMGVGDKIVYFVPKEFHVYHYSSD